jgi:hypothetical protein
MYWESVTKEGVKRKPLLIPKKYFILRKVFSWSSIFRKRFERCLVWYLEPQQIKKDLLISQMPRTQRPPALPHRLLHQHKGAHQQHDVEPGLRVQEAVTGQWR